MPEIPDHKTRNVGSDIYGAARLELAKLVKTQIELLLKDGSDLRVPDLYEVSLSDLAKRIES